jgi:tetratricopeptide (TPR) repeat protein
VPNEEPAALAVPAEKPSRAETAEPKLANKPSQTDKPAHAEKPVHAEKTAPVEKPRAESAQPEPKSAGGKPSEDDYRRANEAYERGNAKLFQGNTAEAIADFNRALRLNPKDPTIHRGLGLAYAQSGKSAEAVKHLKLYLKASPKANDRAIIEKRIDQLHGR